jgi:hypothetical protein
MRTALATLTLTLSASAATGQTVLEARYGAHTDYRFVDLSHTFASHLVLDALYTGVPGANEFLFGVGYQLRGHGFSVAPVVYRVIGKENDERGITLGALLSLDTGGFKGAGFVGHFFRTSGGVPDYDYADALDLTRALGAWEVGISTGYFHQSGRWTWLIGPTVKRNDAKGTWAVSARWGDDTEVRVLRVFVF